MKKQLLTCMLGLVASATALSQTKPYELEREMPVFLDQLKKELEKGTDLSAGVGK